MSTELTQSESRPTQVQITPHLAFLVNSQAFEHLWRVATAYSRSAIVPEHFRKSPDNCFIACQLAMRLEVDPFMLMQSMYVVHGRPGLEAKMAIALANQRGPFTTPIRYRLSGAGMQRQCVAFAEHKAGGEVSATVTMEIAKAEGWIDKPGSKWKTMPDLMLQYRSAMTLIRLYCPEVLMGLYSVDEVEDTVIDVRSEPAKPQMTLDDVLPTAQSDGASEPTAATAEPAPATATDPHAPTAEAAAKEVAAGPSGATSAAPSPYQSYAEKLRRATTVQAVRQLVDQARGDEALNETQYEMLQADGNAAAVRIEAEGKAKKTPSYKRPKVPGELPME